MPFCSKCGREVKGGDKFCPNCGTEMRLLYKIDSSVSVAEQAKIEGIKQRIAEYNRASRDFRIYSILSMLGGGFFFVVSLYFKLLGEYGAVTALQVVAILLWILSVVCFVFALYSISQADKVIEKLEKGKID